MLRIALLYLESVKLDVQHPQEIMSKPEEFVRALQFTYKNITGSWRMGCGVCENKIQSICPLFISISKPIQFSWWRVKDIFLLIPGAKLFSTGFVYFNATLPRGIIIQGWLFLLCFLKVKHLKLAFQGTGWLRGSSSIVSVGVKVFIILIWYECMVYFSPKPEQKYVLNISVFSA